METTEDQTKRADDGVAKKANISLPCEIIEEILSRLPVKSILRFRMVSKPWLSQISDPSFMKLHFTRATTAHRTALFISAYDHSTHKRHFLSAAPEGGPVTHLMTPGDTYSCSNDLTEAEHLNGLVCFFSKNSSSFRYNYHFILNPSTRKIFKLPVPDSDSLKNFTHICYLFGFDESRNEHKILNIRKLYARSDEPTAVEVMIFSMSSLSWRKIEVELPVGFSWHLLGYGTRGSVCLNSVVHLIPRGPFDILAFDLRTEKFSVISTPQGVVPHKSSTRFNYMNGKIVVKDNIPAIININGVLGVVCHDRVIESNEMHLWILQNYENNVWVREIITFPEPWIELSFPFPLDAVNKDEIVFSSSTLSGNVISVLVYNVKMRCFKSLQFTLGPQFLSSKSVRFNQVRCYVESMVPL